MAALVQEADEGSLEIAASVRQDIEDRDFEDHPQLRLPGNISSM